MGVPFRFHLAMTDPDFRRFVGAEEGPQWICRRTIIWAKPLVRLETQEAEGNAMPEPTRDRPSRNYEFLFLFSKQPDYHFDRAAIDVASRSGRRLGNGAGAGTVNPGSVWEARCEVLSDTGGDEGLDDGLDGVWRMNSEASPYRHVAMWPRALVRQMLLPTARPGDTVLDPFAGSWHDGRSRARPGAEGDPDRVVGTGQRSAQRPPPPAQRQFHGGAGRMTLPDAAPEAVDRAFGADNRARLLARYFGAAGPVTAPNAWQHVCRLLLWVKYPTHKGIGLLSSTSASTEARLPER